MKHRFHLGSLKSYRWTRAHLGGGDASLDGRGADKPLMACHRCWWEDSVYRLGKGAWPDMCREHHLQWVLDELQDGMCADCGKTGLHWDADKCDFFCYDVRVGDKEFFLAGCSECCRYRRWLASRMNQLARRSQLDKLQRLIRRADKKMLWLHARPFVLIDVRDPEFNEERFEREDAVMLAIHRLVP